MSEQTELRALADALEKRTTGRLSHSGWVWGRDIELLRRAADRLDRLNAYCAGLEEHGDVL